MTSAAAFPLVNCAHTVHGFYRFSPLPYGNRDQTGTGPNAKAPRRRRGAVSFAGRFPRVVPPVARLKPFEIWLPVRFR